MWQAPLPPVPCFPCLPRQLGSGTKLIWRRDKSRWLAQHDSQVMINEHTLHAHTPAHSHTWLSVSCIRCVYVIYSSECVYRIIDIFISPPFRHKANLLIRAICSTCPLLVRPPPPLSLSPPSLLPLSSLSFASFYLMRLLNLTQILWCELRGITWCKWPTWEFLFCLPLSTPCFVLLFPCCCCCFVAASACRLEIWLQFGVCNFYVLHDNLRLPPVLHFVLHFCLF